MLPCAWMSECLQQQDLDHTAHAAAFFRGLQQAIQEPHEGVNGAIHAIDLVLER